MPRRKPRLTAEHFYHLYNRGHNRQPIFFEEENYLYFLERFHRYLVESGQCDVVAFCLMPNHYHLVIQVRGGWFTRAMQRFLISYTKAINKRYDRSGTLFGGRYQTKRISDTAQLNDLVAYVLANPAEAGLVENARDWPFAGTDWQPIAEQSRRRASARSEAIAAATGR